MNDMEKCFYEPAELSVVDEGKGCSLVKAKGSPYKLGFLVAQGADGIFKSLNDAEAVDAMENPVRTCFARNHGSRSAPAGAKRQAIPA